MALGLATKLAKSKGPANPKYQVDWDLVQLAQAGDQQAWNKLIDRWYHDVRRLCTKLAGNKPSTEDLIQDVILLLYEKIGMWKGKSALSTWAYQVTRNSVFMAWRTSDYKRTQLGEADDIRFSDMRGGEDVQLRSVVDRFTAAVLLDELTPVARMTVELRYLEDHTNREVAQILGIPIGTLKANLFRLKNKLRKVGEKQ